MKHRRRISRPCKRLPGEKRSPTPVADDRHANERYETGFLSCVFVCLLVSFFFFFFFGLLAANDLFRVPARRRFFLLAFRDSVLRSLFFAPWLPSFTEFFSFFWSGRGPLGIRVRDDRDVHPPSFSLSVSFYCFLPYIFFLFFLWVPVFFSGAFSFLRLLLLLDFRSVCIAEGFDVGWPPF